MSGRTASGQVDEHFSYDKVGNRTTDDKTSTTWNYNKNNELQSFDNTSYKYNLNGQLTEKTVDGQTTYYSYNLDGRLKIIKDNNQQVIATYLYDPFGQRISKTLPQESTTYFYHYSDEGLVGEFDSQGQFIQSYGYQPDSLFTTNPVFTHRPDFTEEKGYAFYINDHLATPQKLILRNGRTVWDSSTDAFGKTLITKDEFRNPLRFPGQFKDDESELTYNWNRYYNDKVGRYITSDPIGLFDGINTYLYVDSNPIYWADSDGQAKNKWAGFCLALGLSINMCQALTGQKITRPPGPRREDAELLEEAKKRKKNQRATKGRGVKGVPLLLWDLMQEYCRLGILTGPMYCLPENDRSQQIPLLSCFDDDILKKNNTQQASYVLNKGMRRNNILFNVK